MANEKHDQTGTGIAPIPQATQGDTQRVGSIDAKKPGTHDTLIAIIGIFPLRIVMALLFAYLAMHFYKVFFETEAWRYIFMSFAFRCAALAELLLGVASHLTKLLLVSLIEAIERQGAEL